MKCNKLVDVGRRSFLQGGIVAGAGAAAATLISAQQAKAQTSLALVEYPSNRLANLSELVIDEPVDIAYPDPDSPGVLIKLGKHVPGGAGPDGDIVAYSVQCPHKGWLLGYNAPDRTLNCPGHWSRFDVEAGGQQVWGHATQNLPQFELRVDEAGDVYAEGVDELIYGRLSNVLSA
ncbi:MAG: arsenate reductase (azurin) small subunit [Jannaschia sp.]